MVAEFLTGNHVMKYQQGIFNGIRKDMFIESTSMEYGLGQCVVAGTTLKAETLKR